MKTLVGYITDSKAGTPLTDFHGKSLGWRVDVTITNKRTPEGDRVYVLRLRSGKGKRIGGGLWLGDAGTLFRGQDFGREPNPLDRIARSELDDAIVEEAENWYRADRDDDSRLGENDDDAE